MSRVLKAVKEASISVACLLDDIAVDENNDINIFEIEKDINLLNSKVVANNHAFAYDGGKKRSWAEYLKNQNTFIN